MMKQIEKLTTEVSTGNSIENLNSTTIVLFGISGIGKTTLIQRFINNAQHQKISVYDSGEIYSKEFSIKVNSYPMLFLNPNSILTENIWDYLQDDIANSRNIIIDEADAFLKIVKLDSNFFEDLKKYNSKILLIFQTKQHLERQLPFLKDYYEIELLSQQDTNQSGTDKILHSFFYNPV